MGNFMSCGGKAMFDYLRHRKPVSCTQIEHAAATPIAQPVQPLEMGVDQIHDMDVVANTAAIMGGVISAVDRQRRLR